MQLLMQIASNGAGIAGPTLDGGSQVSGIRIYRLSSMARWTVPSRRVSCHSSARHPASIPLSVLFDNKTGFCVEAHPPSIPSW
jgi:hypothetical protein